MNKKIYLAVGLLVLLVASSGCIEGTDKDAELALLQNRITTLEGEADILSSEIIDLSVQVNDLNSKRIESYILFEKLFYEYFDCSMAYRCQFDDTGGCADMTEEGYRVHAINCEFGFNYIELYEYLITEGEALGMDLNG